MAALLTGATEVVLAGHATGLKSDARRVLQVPTRTLFFSPSVPHTLSVTRHPTIRLPSAGLTPSLTDSVALFSLSGIWSANTRRWRRRWWASSSWTSTPPKISYWRPRADISTNSTQSSEMRAVQPDRVPKPALVPLSRTGATQRAPSTENREGLVS